MTSILIVEDDGIEAVRHICFALGIPVATYQFTNDQEVKDGAFK
jgi:hypothetical protein